ncbi:DUF5331 domain-containing protein [Prochlorothrix hollandica]|uniref:DUF5331 domain-containing protein n=1 Tax=Prochlorothrix hollandica PCC 9006 = CALU 1027 TaxID=317619 RepID=A0A0M2PUG2_PROHO|nr:DUF5331 domain-containing protein [Prochlorothrix hollandica]KKI98752.1 hypothetical protein PROH_18160 [Prochlorothrix hollandica PCC 9006 = CALU 1027]
MAFFESFTASIRQKWLDYYQANRPWLSLEMEGRSVRTPDGGQRPTSSLILGVINALEPKLGNLMVPFFKLNADEDAIVEVLQLNFDPDIELGTNGGNIHHPMGSSDIEMSAGLLPDTLNAANSP